MRDLSDATAGEVMQALSMAQSIHRGYPYQALKWSPPSSETRFETSISACLTVPDSAEESRALSHLFRAPTYLVTDATGAAHLPFSLWPYGVATADSDGLGSSFWKDDAALLRAVDLGALAAAKHVYSAGGSGRLADLVAYWTSLEEQLGRLINGVLPPALNALRGVLRVVVLDAAAYRDCPPGRELPALNAVLELNQTVRMSASRRDADEDLGPGLLLRAPSVEGTQAPMWEAVYGPDLALASLLHVVQFWWTESASGRGDAIAHSEFDELTRKHGLPEEVAALQWMGLQRFGGQIRDVLNRAGAWNARRAAASRFALAVLAGVSPPTPEDYADEQEGARVGRPTESDPEDTWRWWCELQDDPRCRNSQGKFVKARAYVIIVDRHNAEAGDFVIGESMVAKRVNERLRKAGEIE